MKRSSLIIPLLFVLVIAILSSLFIVDERQKALVMRFGRVVDVKEQPGLGFKVPFVDDVVYYEDRILSRDLDPIEVTPSDDRRLIVDAFARYRISDVREFRQAVGSGGEGFAATRLDSILRAELREALGSVSSNSILSSDREALMTTIRNGASAEANALGLEIIDVRLKRTDLPTENLRATYERMKAEREREAADEIARGKEAAQRIRAQADRTVVELTSDANRQAEITRGEADARRNAIFAEVFGADPEFFEFYRSMNAYAKALQSGRSSLVLSPNSEFFDYLKDDNPTNAKPQVTESAAKAALEESRQQAEAARAEQQADEAARQAETQAETAPADGN